MSNDARPWQRLYKLARWQRLRERILTEQPLCMYCLRAGDVEPATVVDHITPHKGDEAMFWDGSNLQPLCKRCHDSDKQREELGQKIIRLGDDGYPIE
ncbi:HNH endonuclease [Falsochrobactrum shanghaiense]|uniref:Putative HNH nuclease YajD n=2 Tax=Falsochrobactrum shanghaiense TaxID=2201899 RepID=A0A316JBU5_9HYPH|nr:HNH endonuclease signature motif containing protein [Falsochrobactrum shanghaiense]PWL18836.1 HNH endonuclease [Falsochrobactrum shanghaiense]